MNEISMDNMGGERAIIIYGDTLKALKEELVTIIGEDLSKALLFRYGFKSGRLTAKNLGISTDIEEAIDIVKNMCAEAGIARIRPLSVSKKEIVLYVEDVVDEDGGNGGDFTRGYIAGSMSEIAKKSFYCVKYENEYHLIEESLYHKKDKEKGEKVV